MDRPRVSIRRARHLVDLARPEREADRAYALGFYDWQDAHMAYARVCHYRRQAEELAKVGQY